MKRQRITLLIFASLITINIKSQTLKFEYKKTAPSSGFQMEGYWVWCGSAIKVGSTYHLFASRWPKTGKFPEGYRTNSEIVRASSKSPSGPWKFEEVVIGERESKFWDSNMAHNPTIHKIGQEYVLFYIGSDFSTLQNNSKALLRRVGYAKSKSIAGPWQRSDEPLIETESNNPAILVEKEGVKLMYRDAKLRVHLAQAKNFQGPYKLLNDNCWPNAPIEDFYLFKFNHQTHLICEDNVGQVSGHVRYGVHLTSKDGDNAWEKGDPVIAYNHDIELTNGEILHCIRRERPQLLIENNRITYLITSVFDGKNSWSQPVKLKNPLKIK